MSAKTRTASASPNGDVWQSFLTKKRLKSTKQRDLIVDEFMAMRGHISLDDLHALVRAKNPAVGFSTVYRTMRLLEEAGLAHERHFEQGRTLYERADARSHHDHLICEKCHHIIEFENDALEALQRKVAIGFGFIITNHRHEIYGLCPKARGEADGYCPAEMAKARSGVVKLRRSS
ncbi:MAG TPA: transcriptional repressor [Polyangia bacterium]|jgi:Fur family ferric uptake transcriptional regulator|nr:transcriptional repressor [Polyangia bacterium]